MLLERDRAVVAEMCRTGMKLETLTRSFPQFAAKDVESVYLEMNEREPDMDTEEVKISRNCS